jgi:hypothetical protein
MIFDCNSFGQKINEELEGIIGNQLLSIKDSFELASIELYIMCFGFELSASLFLSDFFACHKQS